MGVNYFCPVRGAGSADAALIRAGPRVSQNTTIHDREPGIETSTGVNGTATGGLPRPGRAFIAAGCGDLGGIARGGSLGVDAGMSDKKLARDVMPNAERPMVATEKITGYIFCQDNEKGKHKARVLAKAFGLEFNAEDAEYLRSALAKGLASGVVIGAQESAYGMKYKVNIAIMGKNGHIEDVETGWILDDGSDTPRLLTAYLRGRK